MLIICPNLSDKSVAKEFNELVQAVGEDAAYLIWSLNNGNSIDKAPNGAESILFTLLLQLNNNNRFAAIKEKAIMFSEGYTKLSSDENGEVLINDLYLGVPGATYKTYTQIDAKKDHDSYVKSEVFKNIPRIKNNYSITKIEQQASKDWATLKQNEIFGETQKRLMLAFGIVKKGDSYIIPGDNSETARLRILFITETVEHGFIDTYKQKEIDHYIISIGLLNGDATTFNHELAHYYIRRFKNSRLVLTALDLYAKDGMSIDEIEESLVDAITERSLQNEWGDNLKNLSFFHKFWYGFNNLLYKIFGIKNKVYIDYISNQITNSFIINQQLEQTENDSKYQLSYERMYQSTYKSRMHNDKDEPYNPSVVTDLDKITLNIINSTRSKEKSYESRLRGLQDSVVYTQKLSARNKEAQRKSHLYRLLIEDARSRGDVEEEKHQTALMYIDFITNAADEIKEARLMMLNAKANDYRNLYYTINPNGDVLYYDVDNNYYTPSTNIENLLSHSYSFDDLEYVKTDVIGFFLPIIRDMYNNLLYMQKDGFSQQDVEALKNIFNSTKIFGFINDVDSTWRHALLKKSIDFIDEIVDNRVDLDSDHKQRLRINMYKWLNDQMDYGDVKAAELYIGIGSKSKSPILRAVQDIIYQMQNEKGDKTYEVATELNTLREKAEKSMGRKYKYFYNVQKLILQLDKNGLPTGDLISRINKGLYYNDRDEFRDSLLFGKSPNKNWKYNTKSIEQQIKDITLDNGRKLVSDDWELLIDANGILILPQNDKCNLVYKNYLREYETWVSEHTDRPYTLKYYLDRIDTLSIQTLIALEKVNNKINDVKRTCIRNGVPQYNLLTLSQTNIINLLSEERDLLRNFYDDDYNIKTGDEYQIAYDLMLWGRKTQGKLVYITNTDLYEQCKKNSSNQTKFEQNFSSVKINPILFLNNKNSRIPESDKDYQELKSTYYQKYQLLNKFRGQKIGEIKWDLLFDEKTKRLKNVLFWKLLNSLDSRIDNLNSILYQRYPPDEKLKIKNDVLNRYHIPYNYLKRLNVDWADSTEERWFEHITNALAEASTETENIDEKNEIIREARLLLSFNSAVGYDTPLSIFYATVPSVNQVEIDGHLHNTLIRLPNGLFSTIDKNNSSEEYVNKSYTESEDGFVLPKESLYKDDRWKVVENNEDLLNFYNKVKEKMEEAWKYLPLNSRYDGRASQMGGRTGQILGRNIKTQFGKNIKEFLRREFSVVETDLEFRPVMDRELRPDGSDIENIPIRFLKRLDDPTYISSDVVWSTICFYDMALNFKVKMDNLSSLISLFRRLDENKIADKYKSLFDARQADVLKGMLDRQLYEKLVTVAKSASQLLHDAQKEGSDKEIIKHGPNWFKSAMGTSKDWLKRVGKLRISLLLGMLAWNIPSGIVSFLDPLISLIIDSVTGKYINAKDVCFALKEMAKEFPLAVYGTGGVRAYCKAHALMLKNELSKRITESFKHTDKILALRFVEGLSMKIFSSGDYAMNTINMVATYHNYRYYKSPNGTAAFYPKHVFIKTVMESENCSVEDARKKYKSAINLYDCYKVDETGKAILRTDGEFDLYSSALDKKTEHAIRTQVKSRSSTYNGIVPDAERTLMLTNIILAFFTMLRNFMITGLWERFLTYRDFLVSTFDENGNPELRAASLLEIANAKKQQNYYKGGYSFSTHQIENAVTWSALYGYRLAATQFRTYLQYAKNSNNYKYTEEGLRFMKENNISEQDIYGMLKVFLECMCWLSLLISSSFVQAAADDDKDNYFKLFANLMLLRLAIERYTWYSPETAMELIKSPTTAMSDWLRKLKIVALGEDFVTYFSVLLSLTDEGSYDELIKRGYYKNQPRWKRDLYSVLSSTGIHNWYKSMPEYLGGSGAYGLRETMKFYKLLEPDWYKWIEEKIQSDDVADDYWYEW